MNLNQVREAFRRHALLIPLFVISIFGFGYQAIPVLSWFFIPILLTYTRYNSRWRIFNVFLIMESGLLLAFLGTLRQLADGPRYPGVGTILGGITVISIAIILVTLGDHFVTSNRNCVSTRTYFFSTMWTFAWYMIALFGGYGDYFSPTVSLVNWPDFAQLAALGGRPLLEFIFAIFGTSFLELNRYPVPALSLFIGRPDTTVLVENEAGLPEQEEEERLTKKEAFRVLWVHPMTKFFILVSLLVAYGGARVNIRDKSLYQASYPEYLPPVVPVGCVAGPGDEYPELSKEQDIWLEKSKSLIESGAKLVLWSEITTVIGTEEDETVFLDKVKDLAVTNQVYMAVAYRRLEPINENKLVFVLKNGTVGFDYKKAHPAPGEPQSPGPHNVPYVDTEDFGRVGGAICFDYSYPRFISQAATNKIDLMLQPSWTWGPIGTYFEQNNILRPVENGFTLLKCSTQGISGVFEPTLNSIYTQKVPTLNNDKYLFYLPVQKRVATLYSYIGNVLVYICLALGTFIFTFIANTVRKNRKLSI